MPIDRETKIAVIGGGLAGFSIAIMLKKSGFTSVTVYERDECLSQRRQGYGLTLLQGITALKTLGHNCFDRVKMIDTPSRSHYIFDNSGKIINFFGTIFWQTEESIQKIKNNKKYNLHISRTNLRNIIYDECLKTGASVKWNYKLNKIENSMIEFSNGESVEADMIIGCDGIKSQVRKFKYKSDEDFPLNYLGMIMVLGITYSDHPLSQKRVFQTVDGCTRLFCMPYTCEKTSHNFMWQLSFPLQEQEAKRLSADVKLLKENILERCRDWHEPVTSIIKSTEFEFLMGIPAYDREAKLPVVESTGNMVLLGDAAHPMSPFKGQGANQTLIDAVSLGSFIAESETIEKAIQSYEMEMINRVRSKVELSRERVKTFHDADILNSDSFEYRGSNKELLNRLAEKKINSESGDDIENLILREMKDLKLV